MMKCAAVALLAFAAPAATVAAEPGTLTIAESVPPQTFDPIQSSQIRTWYLWQFAYQGLIRAELDGSILPVLATSWKASDDGKVYEFTLRDGVKFSDGSPMAADDVVASFERLKANGLPYAQDRFKSLEKVEAIDPVHVRFTLSHPDAGFLLNLGNPFVVGSAIMSKNWLAGHNAKTEMMGTGPFEMVSYDPNTQLVLRRNDNYWDKAGMAKVANLTIRYMPEESAQIAGLMSGQIDLMFPSAESMLQLSRMPDIATKAVASTNTIRLNINTNRAPFNSVDFRRAMSLALSREDIVAGSFLGKGTPSSQIPPAYSWAVKLSDLEYQHQDIKKAKELMAKAGYPNGVDITLNHLAGYASYLDRFAEIVKTDMAKVGIRVTIQPNQTAVWLDKQNHANYDIMTNEYAYQADPMFYLMPRPGRQGPNPKEMDDLIAKAQTGPAGEYTANLAALERMQDDLVFPDITVAARDAWVAFTKKLDANTVKPNSILSRTFLADVVLK
jgi:peptide/nickel transport system substrate-binding protein